MNNSKKIGLAVSSVIIFTLIAKFLGFFREIFLSYFFGATGVSDAYLISQNIPGTIFQFVGTGLTTCFIPIFFKVLKKHGKKKSDLFTNTLITLVMILSTIIIVLIWIFTPQVVKIFASGFKGQTFYYAVKFTRIGVLSLYFSTIIYIYNSYLQANQVFGPTAFAAIPNSIFVMISIVLGAKVNIWLLPVGSCLAVGIQMLFLIYPVHKLSFSLKPRIDLSDPYVRQFFALLLPVIFGVSVNQIDTLIDRTVASQVAVGGISALTYANSLIMFVQGGLVDPVNTVFYPQITEAATSNNEELARKSVEKTLNMVLTLLVPISVAFIVFRTLITQALFGRGAFNSNASLMTSDALCFYAVGICFIGIREMLSLLYYAHSNTRIPMRNAMIGVAVKIAMNLSLSRVWGISGLATATSLSAFITATLLWMGCDKHLHSGKIHISLVDFFKTIINTGITIGIVYFISTRLQTENIIKLLIIIIIAVVIYCVLGMLFKIELFREALQIINRKGKHKFE